MINIVNSDNALSANLLKQLFDELFEYSIYKCVEIEDISQYETIEDLISRCNNPILIQRISCVLNLDKLKIISSIARCVYESIDSLNYINESIDYRLYMKKIVIELINCENGITDFNRIFAIIHKQRCANSNLSSKVNGYFEGYSEGYLHGAIKMGIALYEVYEEEYNSTPKKIAEYLAYCAYESIYRICELNKDNLDYLVSGDISVLLASEAVYFDCMLDYQHELGKPRSYIDPYTYEQKAKENKQKNIIKCSNILRERLGRDIINKVNELLHK